MAKAISRYKVGDTVTSANGWAVRKIVFIGDGKDPDGEKIKVIRSYDPRVHSEAPDEPEEMSVGQFETFFEDGTVEREDS